MAGLRLARHCAKQIQVDSQEIPTKSAVFVNAWSVSARVQQHAQIEARTKMNAMGGSKKGETSSWVLKVKPKMHNRCCNLLTSLKPTNFGPRRNTSLLSALLIHAHHGLFQTRLLQHVAYGPGRAPMAFLQNSFVRFSRGSIPRIFWRYVACPAWRLFYGSAALTTSRVF